MSAKPVALPPADLRLLVPTATAWAVTALVLGAGPVSRSELPLLAVPAALLALLLFAVRTPRRTALLRTLAAALLTATAAVTTTVLHTADLYRGPLPALAVSGAELTVDLTVTGDPKSRTGHTNGTTPGQPRLLVPARVDRVGATATRTPVTVTVRAKDAAAWRTLIPSTRVRAAVHVLPNAAPEAPATPEAPAIPPASDTPLAPPALAGPPPPVPDPPPATSAEAVPLAPAVRALSTAGPDSRPAADDASTADPAAPSAPSASSGGAVADGPVTAARTTAVRTDSAALLVALGPPRLLAPPSLPQRAAARLRAGLRDACDHLPPDTRGLLPGLVVGDTSRLPDDLADAFRATDLGHLTAVSGANFGILLAVLLGTPSTAGTARRGGLAARLGLSLRTTAAVGTALTLAFVTVCRPDPSVLRAAATGLIALLALATGRPRQGLPALCGAVLVLLLLDPPLARSYGFLLSALATAGLLTLGPRWAAALQARHWPPHLASAVAATAAAQAFCAPVTILLAPRVSLVAVPCNLLAEAAVAPATLLGFAVLATDPVSHPAARFLADLAAVPAAWLVTVARRGAALPGAELAWPHGLAGAGLLVAVTVALCWAVPPLLATRRLRGNRARALLALALAVLLPAVLLRPPSLVRIATGWPPPGWRLVLCDIGQGDMAVLPLGGDSAVVVDAGPEPKAADACLRELGISRIPLLVLTHFHADHAEGLPGVLRGRAVGALQVTTLDAPPGERARVTGWAQAARIPVLRAGRGERRTAGPGLSWEVLWPDTVPAPDAPGPNNASVALLVTVGTGRDAVRIALLGDLEPAAQAAVLRRGPPLGPVDVLKVAHHGSANQDRALTAALHPRLALISCGIGNPYGHPSPHTVADLRGLGATVLRTDQRGDIAVLGTHDRLTAATHPHPPRG
ncbi:ComEC/Rec2 family competence protein [Kitasatospora sp. NPDC048365]|uniref:ComEC/Rec2 family competence protein n=1 Tax=Kitasatospora sp. NPDC048365 TaxID=3364050 RepID=UPI0037235E7C